MKRNILRDLQICISVPLTIFAKSSIVDVRKGSEYISAIRIIQNKTKFLHTKEHLYWRSTKHLQVV